MNKFLGKSKYSIHQRPSPPLVAEHLKRAPDPFTIVGNQFVYFGSQEKYTHKLTRVYIYKLVVAVEKYILWHQK